MVSSEICPYIWAINEQQHAMKSQMHPERIAALEAYRAAIRATASAQTEEECAMLIIAEDAALRHSVAMDAKYPTASELKRKANRDHMNSIGLWNW